MGTDCSFDFACGFRFCLYSTGGHVVLSYTRLGFLYDTRITPRVTKRERKELTDALILSFFRSLSRSLCVCVCVCVCVCIRYTMASPRVYMYYVCIKALRG